MGGALFLTQIEGFVSIKKARESGDVSTASQALYLQDRFQKEAALEQQLSTVEMSSFSK